MKIVCICGGGAFGHVISGALSSQQKYPLQVNLLTNKPSEWVNDIVINTPDRSKLLGRLSLISDKPEDVVPQSDIILICLPGFLIKYELERIKDFLPARAYVGCVFSSTGFFFEALKLLPKTIRLWGFQRVPYIARTIEYGHSANLLGYKSEHRIAVERAGTDEKEDFRKIIETVFDCPIVLLNNYLEASITNSNPLLHTSRLYTMFKDWKPGVSYSKNYLFYEEWTNEAADLYIRMDEELFRLISVLPVSKDFLPKVLDYYDSTDAESLRDKLSSIDSFRGILSPMKEVSDGQWIPDFESRYFVEDFGCSLRYTWELIQENNIDAPFINEVYHWGAYVLNKG